MKENHTTEAVYSTVEDKNITKTLGDSEIWNECYHKDELPSNFKGYKYLFLFKGLTPVVCKGKPKKCSFNN